MRKNVSLGVFMGMMLSILQVPVFAAPAYTAASTPLGELIDNEQTRAVIDKHLPGLSTNPAIEMARGMTLPAMKPFAADSITDEVISKIDADLASIPAPKN
jgi:hypothetical protein